MIEAKWWRMHPFAAWDKRMNLLLRLKQDHLCTQNHVKRLVSSTGQLKGRYKLTIDMSGKKGLAKR